MTADGKGGLAFITDAVDGLVIQKDVTFTGTYSVLNAGRVTVTSNANASWVFYLVNKNQAFLLDTSRNTAFGFVEPQAAAPTGGFTNSSFSGPFSAGTVAPSVTANTNATGVTTLDGAGNFSESATLSNTSGLFVNDKTTGTYSVSTNGRGTVTRLAISIAGIGGSLICFLLFLSLLLGRLVPRCNPSRTRLALFCAAVLIVPMLAGCPQITNQLVFYVISPTKAVMMHEATSSDTGTTIIEQ